MKPTPSDKVTETPTSVYWFDSSDILCVVLRQGVISIHERKKITDSFKHSHRGKRYCGLIDISAFSPLSKELRAFNAQELPNIFKAIAFVSSSALGSMAAHIYMGVRRSPLPFKIFSNEKEARGWLQQFL